MLEIKNLKVRYDSSILALRGIDLSLLEGETLALIGESGSGKTSLALALMGLLPRNAELSGKINYKGQELTSLSDEEMDGLRWSKIALVFQNSLDALNPLLKVREQLSEAIVRHLAFHKDTAKKRAAELLSRCGLDASAHDAYPFQLSGGMRQRVLLAMALSCEPDLLIADELSMGLDPLSKRELIELLQSLKEDFSLSMILITHDLAFGRELSNRMAVLYGGDLVEEAETDSLLFEPRHPYTRALISSSPEINPYLDMWGIPGETGSQSQAGCAFSGRCTQSIDICGRTRPELKSLPCGRKLACHRGGIVTLLEACGISKEYRIEGDKIQACKNCYLDLKAGEVVSLIGASGSGKSTLAEIMSGVRSADEGEVYFGGKKLEPMTAGARLGGLQIVFQDPYSSLNEQMLIRDIVLEGLELLKYPEAKAEERLQEVLKAVQLPTEKSFVERRAFTLSGGQRQRIALARAMTMEPQVLIADEITSMLDPSTGANILRLLKSLQNKYGFSMLFITHDLAFAAKISNRIFVMEEGAIVESGPAMLIYKEAGTAYTQSLLSAASLYDLP